MKTKRFFTLLTVMAMALTLLAGCKTAENPNSNNPGDSNAPQESQSGNGITVGEDEITDLVLWALASNEITTVQYTYSESSRESILASGYDCWLGSDPVTTEVRYKLADSYETTDGGTTWVFHLRDGATWVDYQGNYKADVTIEDFLTGAEYILNYWKNDGNNTGTLISTIEGAGDYYEYTKTLSEDEAYALTYEDKFSEMVGISADSAANTVTYVCSQPTAYFWSIATRVFTAPLPAGAIEEVGVKNYNSISWDQRWYCGPYTMVSYTPGNEKVFAKNESYWNIDNVKLFDTLTIKMIESNEVGYQLYANGEIDQIDMTESVLTSIINNENHEFYDYVVQKYEKASINTLLFNFNKNLEDGTPDVNWNTAAANEAFRLSIYWGLDMTSLLSFSNPITPNSVAGYNFSHDLMCSNTSGVDYQQLVLKAAGITPSDDEYQRYNPTLAEQYKEQAIEELTAKGVTFPVELDFYVAAGTQTELDRANIIKSIFDTCLGTDYIQFTIKSYISSASSEVYTPSLHSMNISSWKADYADPLNTIGQFVLHDEDAVYSTGYQKSNEATDPDLVATLEEFTQMVNDAADIYDDIDSRYDLFAEAEAYYLNHGLMVPLYKNIAWQLTRVNDYSKMDTQYIGWDTNKNGYTAEQYAAFKKEVLG